MENIVQRLKLTVVSLLSALWINAYAESNFIGTISPVPKNIQQKMINHSWHKGCPVAIDDLAYLKISYWGFDDKIHAGELIINKRLATETINIFRKLFEIKYPIQEIALYDKYPVGEYGKHNDTVGFYCRPPANGNSKFSEHAYGIAIDINPLTNPYVKKSNNIVWPADAENYVDPNPHKKGMIKAGDKVFAIFTNYGWEWGGLWKNEQDYMHFQKFIAGHYLIKSMKYIPSGDILLSPEVRGCG